MPAVSSNYTAGDQLYVRHRVWTVGQTESVDKYIAWDGTPALNESNGSYYIPAGTAKLADGDYTNSVTPKAPDANKTETAATVIATSFEGGITASSLLGNNGRLSIPVPGTLAVTKRIAAGAGFDLPADPVPSASFTLSLKGADGSSLNQADTYRALIRDAAGHPVDPATHAAVTSADAAKFYVKDGDAFVLRDGETLKVTNLPDGATYSVEEAGQAGYAATVTDNDGTVTEFGRGEASHTTPAE